MNIELKQITYLSRLDQSMQPALICPADGRSLVRWQFVCTRGAMVWRL